MSLLRFSIVMPTYNHGRWIDIALRSIFDQGVSDPEVIVIDSVSTDETPQILAGYRDRITWRCEKDNGQADAINRGFTVVRGDIVAWLNSDDTYLPGAFARVEAAFAAACAMRMDMAPARSPIPDPRSFCPIRPPHSPPLAPAPARPSDRTSGR